MSYSFLCFAEEFKGASFLTTLKALGHRVFVVTTEKARYAPWPRHAIDEIFYAPEGDDKPHNRQALVEGTAWLARNQGIDRIIALDDFDVEDAALLREEFRIPGMGQTTARYFRDKLAMRMRAEEHGIPVPAFSALFSKGQLEDFCQRVPGPYVIKPRSEASASGIRRVNDFEEALSVWHQLGEEAYRYLIEAFAPGKVYHVDALVKDGNLVFSRSSVYADPPLAIVQGGGLFQTRMMSKTAKASKKLTSLTGKVMQAFGMRFSASHTEFIEDEDGNFLFLETSSRVGGAYISNMVAYATGVDLWAEWAKLEVAELTGGTYKAPKEQAGFGAVTIRAVSEEYPDLEEFKHPQVKAFISKPFHAGVIIMDKKATKVAEIQDDIAARFKSRFG